MTAVSCGTEVRERRGEKTVREGPSWEQKTPFPSPHPYASRGSGGSGPTTPLLSGQLAWAESGIQSTAVLLARATGAPSKGDGQICATLYLFALEKAVYTGREFLT